MRVPKIYLETTIFNFVYADDASDKKADTLKLFEEIKAGKYQPFTSAYVTKELERASDDKRIKMNNLIKAYNVKVLLPNDDISRLAGVYVSEGVIPVKYETDALHLAAATLNDIDFVVSWNFRHIVKRKTMVMTELINSRYNYKKIGIYSPSEVIENE